MDLRRVAALDNGTAAQSFSLDTQPRTMSTAGLFGHAVRGVRWIALSRFVVQVVTWFFTLFVIRLLKPSDYGLISMAGLVTTLAGLLLDAGLGAAFVQRRNVTEDVYRAATTALIIGTAGAILIIQAVAGGIARYFNAELLEPVLRVYSLQFLLSAFTVVSYAILTVEMRFRELAIVQIVFGIGQALMTILLAVLGAGVWSLVVGVLFGGVLKALLLMQYAKPPRGLCMRFSLLRPYVRFSGFLLAQRATWFWAEQADQFFIASSLGALPLGTFAVAKNLAQMPLDRAGEVINQVALPSFAAVQGDMAKWLHGYEKLIRLASAVSYPMFWGAAAVAPVALPLVLGDKWTETVLPFILLCLMLPLRVAHSLSATTLLAIGRADVSFKAVGVWAVVLSPLFFVGAHYGLVQVALAWTLGFPLAYLWCILIIARNLKIPARAMIAPMLAPASAGAVAALAAVVTGWACRGLPPAAILLMQTTAGIAAYVAFVRFSLAPLYSELRDLVEQLIRRRALS
jgi:teichuronic acid exporter